MILRPLFQWRPYRGEGILATIVKNINQSSIKNLAIIIAECNCPVFPLRIKQFKFHKLSLLSPRLPLQVLFR